MMGAYDLDLNLIIMSQVLQLKWLQHFIKTIKAGKRTQGGKLEMGMHRQATSRTQSAAAPEGRLPATVPCPYR